MESEREVPLMTPLSARSYLEAYYVLSDPKVSSDLVPLVERFNNWDLIKAEVLEDTWPGEGWEEAEAFEEDEETQPDAEVSAGPHVELGKLEIAHKEASSTLRDRAMDKLLQSLLEEPDDNSHLTAEAELLTDFLPRMKAKFYEHANKLKPSPSLLNLLCRTLENDCEVDLSPLTTLTTDDLCFLVSKLQKDGKINTLNLSNRPDIGEQDLRGILASNSNLRALYLLEMPQIPFQSLAVYASHCDVLHSEILRMPLLNTRKRPTLDQTFSRGNTISQIQWLGLSFRDSMEPKYRLENGQIAWDTLKLAARAGRYQYGPSRGELEHNKCGIDIPFPAGKMVQGFSRLLQWGASADLTSSYSGTWSKGVACCLAAPPPHSSSGTGHGVSLLSPDLWLDRSRYDDSPKEEVPSALAPGQWALILFSEAYNTDSQESVDEVFEEEYPTANASAKDPSGQADADRKDSSSRTDNGPLQTSLDKEAKMNIEALLFGDINQLRFPKDKQKELSSPNKKPPSFRPRKGVKYALVTPVAGSETEFRVADVPSYLAQVMGNTTEAQELTNLWQSRIAALDMAQYFGDDEGFDGFLQKIFPGKVGAKPDVA